MTATRRAIRGGREAIAKFCYERHACPNGQACEPGAKSWPAERESVRRIVVHHGSRAG
jgi:hypothetical protein